MKAKLRIRLGWVVGVLSCILFSTAVAEVVFQETFEEPHALNRWRQHGGCWDHSFKVVQDPCSSSVDNKVVQITNIMGKDNSKCKKPVWQHPVSKNPLAYKHRSELMPDEEKTRARPDEDFWVGFRSFIDPTYPQGRDLMSFHVTQIIPDHATQKANGTDMALLITGSGTWLYTVRKTLVSEKREDEKRGLGHIERGKWTNWVIHYKRSIHQGVAEVWKDGERVFDWKGITSQNTEKRGLWKFGLYRGSAVDPKHFGETYTIYFDDVKIATGPSQFEAVRPDVDASTCSDRPTPQKDVRINKKG
jgi:hypothetical protein